MRVRYITLHKSQSLGPTELLLLSLLAEKYSESERPDFNNIPGLIGTGRSYRTFGEMFIIAASSIIDTWKGYILATSIMLVYGGCHAAAWNTHFPSSLECLLWIISLLVSLALPGVLALENFIACLPCFIVLSTFIAEFDSEIRVLGIIRRVFQHIPFISFLLAIVECGRLILFVEAFVSLRSLLRYYCLGRLLAASLVYRFPTFVSLTVLQDLGCLLNSYFGGENIPLVVSVYVRSRPMSPNNGHCQRD